MDKFEYKTSCESFKSNTPRTDYEKYLNDWGALGWELVAETIYTYWYGGFSASLTWKRKVPSVAS